MKRSTHHFGFPVAQVVVMAALLSALFMADAPPSQAASTKKKAVEVSQTSVERTESRIVQLKGALAITEDQGVLWTNVAQAMRENALNMDALSKVRAEKAKTMTAVETLRFHTQLTEAQLEQQKKFIPPFEALYASLSDLQKSTADTMFRTGKHGKHKIK
jgi:periplasmic protein CpxP/Spy